MAGEEGFEPSHAGIKIQCLNQLGDSPAMPTILSLLKCVLDEIPKKICQGANRPLAAALRDQKAAYPLAPAREAREQARSACGSSPESTRLCNGLLRKFSPKPLEPPDTTAALYSSARIFRPLLARSLSNSIFLNGCTAKASGLTFSRNTCRIFCPVSETSCAMACSSKAQS